MNSRRLSEFLPLVGAREIAVRLGVSRQRVQQLADRDDFPEPFHELSMGRIWWRHEVEEWIVRWHAGERRCGAPADDSGRDGFRPVAERIADHLAERGDAFIEGEAIDVLGDLILVFLKNAGVTHRRSRSF
ncbi:AlpA family transcriptional regulator [Actinoplanes sp. L3-i22]|uniref:helix-turn-helix transcriptional regulator n=1 Tax=Actinoplanes sp. L3-i22 TaxID=2836373 RepID=UPI001C78ED67|nr:hypothetical protein [Actinoplanes sp. L3-i22]BCY09169.1 hypothetical protein L3i22_042570 [Actinoplanes sp. L3-i22]